MKFVPKIFDLPVKITHLVNLHYFEFANNYHTREDSHAFYELVYVDSGWLNIASEYYDGRLNQRQMILHLPDEPHALSCDKNVAPEVIIIEFIGECKELAPFAKKPFTLNTALQKLLAEIIREGFAAFAPPYDVPNMPELKRRPTKPYGAEQLIRNLLEEFWIRAVRSSDSRQIQTDSTKFADSEFVARIEQYIQENLSTHITIGELCLLFNTNKTTLHRAFRAATGATVVQRINRMRIHAAKTLIREQNLNFTQISEKVGFSSVHYFTRVFAQYEKITPSEYSKTIRARLAISDEI